MTRRNFLKLDQHEINLAEEKEENGAKVKVMLSMFDVPEKASAEYDKRKKIVRFRFSYLGGDEPTEEKVGENGITLVLGKHSDRLYRIDVRLNDIPQLSEKDEKFSLVIKIAEESVSDYKAAHPNIKSRSLEAVNRVFDSYSENLKPLVRDIVAYQ